jgi:hypothetical protein
MVTIRDSQMEALARATRARFEENMVVRLRAAHAKAAAMSPAALHELIVAGIERALTHDLQTPGQVARFLDYVVLFGPALDAAPFRGIDDILADQEMNGAEKIGFIDDCLGRAER